MFRFQRSWIVAAALLAAIVPLRAMAQNSELPLQAGQDEQAETAKCLAIIKSADATDNAKAVAFKRLAIFGTKYAVNELAPILQDPKWAHYARYSLEPLPDPSVDEAFRAALAKLQGNLLIGVVNSIGVRQDPDAVEALTGLLGSRDENVVAAAAAALGRIATKEAVAQLKTQLAKTKGRLKIDVADACLTCADELLAKGDRPAAIGMLETVREADVPQFVVEAAAQNLILAQGEQGIPLMVEQLKSDNLAMRGVGLRAARLIKSEAVGKALLELLGQVPADQQAKLITAMADRGDKRALAEVVKAASSSNKELRLAAIEALVKLGGADQVGLLMKAAADADPDVVAAAKMVLVDTPGAEVDAAVAALVPSSEGTALALAIEIAGQRRVMAASGALQKLAESANDEIRLAAIKALGTTVGVDDLPALVRRLVAAKSPAEQEVVKQAIKDTGIRMPDVDACAEKLAGCMSGAPADVQVFLLEMLRDVSGPAALKAVIAAAESGEDAVRDAATRVLGEWIDAAAAPSLLELAKKLNEAKYKIRAVRGYIRIARQLNPSDEERMAICRNTLAIADRADEKKLVMEVLERYPSAASLAIAVSAVGDRDVSEEASAAAVAVAGKIVDAEKAAVAAAMPKVIEAAKSAETVKRAKSLLNRAK